MQARFLLGPAGSGKTFRCLGEIRAALKQSPEGPPLILLAPKQSTFQLERQLLSDPALPGYTRLQILSFERLAEFAVNEFQTPPRLLDEEGRLMVLRALLTRQHKDLKIFRATARLPGFAQQLSVLLRELQRHQLLDRKLAALAARKDLPEVLRNKLHDFAVLLGAYRDWIKQHQLQDANELLDIATETLRGFSSPTPHLQIAELWLDGFAEMTPQELDFLAAIVPLCGRATLAFCLDPDANPMEKASWLSPWAVIGRTFRKCHQRFSALPGCNVEMEYLRREPGKGRFASSPALAQLEQYWAKPEALTRFTERSNAAVSLSSPKGGEGQGEGVSGFTAKHPSPQPSPRLSGERESSAVAKSTPAVRVIECTDPESEAVFAAREILRHVRGGGRYRDCAVLVRSLDNCHNELRRVLQRYEIPFFLDRREPLAHHPLAELTRFALRTASSGWEHNDWFGALKTGLVTDDEAGVDELENEALARGWKGKFWREPMVNVPEADAADLQRWEAMRRAFVGPIENLTVALERARFQPTGPQVAQAIRNLWDDARVDETLERWSTEVAGVPTVHSTVREQMSAWLDNVEMAFSAEALPMRDWLPILEAGLANLSVGVIPPALDQVLVGAIDRSRSPDLMLALLLGVNEGIFPAPPRTTSLLTESDRDALDNRGIELSSSKLDQLGHERYYGYIACTRASERLVLTYARRDTRDKALNPSPFIAHLQRIFPSLQVEFQDRPLPGPLPQEREKHSPALADLRAVGDWARGLPVASATSANEKNELSVSAAPSSLAPIGGEGAASTNQPALISNRNWSRIEHPNELAPLLVQMQNEPKTDLLKIPQLAALAEKLRPLQQPSPAKAIPPAFAEKLYGPIFKTSVSAIERFAACPFKFFVHSGLRAEERQLFEVDARERGSFQHEVLRRFHEKLRAIPAEWRTLKPEEARDLIGIIAKQVAREYRQGLFEASPESLFAAESLAGSLQDLMETIIGWMPDYGFNPREVELSFGFPGDILPAWEIDLGEGHRMAFRGKIDRIDLVPGETKGEALFVVIDYKSSGKEIDPLLLECGAQIQLPAYLAALQKVSQTAPQVFHGARLIPVGAFYVNLRGDYDSGASRDEILGDIAAARRAAYRHTGRFSISALRSLDRRSPNGNSGQFNYSINKNGEPSRTKKDIMPPANFAGLLAHTEELLRAMGRRIFAGETAVDPYRKGSETACDYCECQAICRIDKWRHEFRVLRAKKEVVE